MDGAIRGLVCTKIGEVPTPNWFIVPHGTTMYMFELRDDEWWVRPDTGKIIDEGMKYSYTLPDRVRTGPFPSYRWECVKRGRSRRADGNLPEPVLTAALSRMRELLRSYLVEIGHTDLVTP